MHQNDYPIKLYIKVYPPEEGKKPSQFVDKFVIGPEIYERDEKDYKKQLFGPLIPHEGEMAEIIYHGWDEKRRTAVLENIKEDGMTLDWRS